MNLKPLALVAAFALAEACATPRTACSLSSRSPLLTCWKVVESKVDPNDGMRVGSLLYFEDTQVDLYDDEFFWVRMPIEWKPPPSKAQISGTYRMGGNVDLAVERGKLLIRDGEKVIGRAELVEGKPAEEALAQFQKLPTLDALRERTRACFEAYRELVPDDPVVDRVDLTMQDTTATAHGLLYLVQLKLADRCLARPEVCSLPPMSAEQREKLASRERQCSESREAP
jgi:hypothetical protein